MKLSQKIIFEGVSYLNANYYILLTQNIPYDAVQFTTVTLAINWS